jgi:type VI secretion system secreted protein Hcp
MAVDAFLKIGDLKGESVAKGFEGQIELLSWSWGMSQSGTTHRGTGGGAGKVNVQDLSIAKYVDTSSPNLVLACCNGKHFPEAVLTLRKAGEKPLDYLIIKMTDVIITSVSSSGSGGDELIVESASLNFAKFTYAYQAQDKSGAKSGGAIEVQYDIAANA